MKKRFVFLICWGILFGVLSGCQKATPAVSELAVILEESPVQEIALDGLVAEAKAEISGMAWCGEKLILLPQYPGLFEVDQTPSVFAIPVGDLESYLEGEALAALSPAWLPFYEADLSSLIPGFEGFESIAFDADHFYVTIEASPAGGMQGYLAKGTVSADCDGLTLDQDSLVPLTPQAELGNMTDETIVIFEDHVYTFYEANGVNVNPNPHATQFSPDLSMRVEIPFEGIEYRVTDASTPDTGGLFWVINYFYPGDTKLKPGTDQIVEKFGIGESHIQYPQVERLVAYQMTPGGIILAAEEPIYLVLPDDEARNWEGLVKFGDGFLIITDKFPTTILGWVLP